MTPPLVPRPGRGEETRLRLLRVASALYAERGVAGTTTEALAARAGVAEGTIYRHFPGKEGLYRAAVEQADRWLLGVVRAADTGDGVELCLARIAQRMVEAARREPGVVRLALAHPDDALLDPATRLCAEEAMGFLHQVMVKGKQEGRVRPGAVELWADLWLHLVGFAVTRVASGAWTEDHPQIAATIAAAQRMVLSPTAPTPQDMGRRT